MTVAPLVMSFIAGLQLRMWETLMSLEPDGTLRFILIAFMVLFTSQWMEMVLFQIRKYSEITLSPV
jgi:hypothetical protein